MAEFNRVATTCLAKHWVKSLAKQTLAYEAEHYPRARARQQAAFESFNGAIGAFAADLMYHYGNHEAEGFMYRPLDREELSHTLVSARNFEKLVQYWGNLGWLEMTGHIKATDDWEGQKIPGYSRARRYRATVSFVEQAQACQITPDTVTAHFEINGNQVDLVQFRETNKTAHGQRRGGKRVRLKGPAADYQLQTMRRLNRAMQAHSYSLKEPPTLRRLFNCVERDGFDFDLGGRFYCSSSDDWMEMPKEERKHITIDGEATTEIDVSASHLFILYAIHGERLDYVSDPYNVAEYPRDVVKQIIVTMIGAGKPPQRWPKGFTKRYKQQHGHLPIKDYKLKDVREAVLRKHPLLKKLKTGKLDWANLQFEEAECFLAAMLSLHEAKSIPSLPVHDSLIVRQSDVHIAKEILEKSYKDRLGFAPKVTISPPKEIFGYPRGTLRYPSKLY
ncbi:hypothetical protein ISM_06125 [Roseovarius nubinhibens ISM]|uniref:DNA-directed DNA polymerase family A palm domain-containing protein n=2 Tax=Roseovarius nubinhibens TaxID=314263 RepID=A3SKG7_ROSNI|nr:hypothetical protein ISM_06125 [Roseovarius nubinhibens ISM]